MASSMGATAFQKGLGMIHSMAHPLSSECGLHHGLANALCLPICVEFLENSKLNSDQQRRIAKIQQLFAERSLDKETLAKSCHSFFESLGINFGLLNHGVTKQDIDNLSHKAFLDGCHGTNMIPVVEDQFKQVFTKAL